MRTPHWMHDGSASPGGDLSSDPAALPSRYGLLGGEALVDHRVVAAARQLVDRRGDVAAATADLDRVVTVGQAAIARDGAAERQRRVALRVARIERGGLREIEIAERERGRGAAADRRELQGRHAGGRADVLH